MKYMIQQEVLSRKVVIGKMKRFTITYLLEQPVYVVEAENLEEAYKITDKLHAADNLNFLQVMDTDIIVEEI